MPDALWKAGATTITLDHVVKNALTTVASPWGWCLFSGLHSSHPRSTVERDREAAGRESRFHACSDVTRGRPESITVRPTRSAPRAGKTEVPSGMIRYRLRTTLHAACERRTNWHEPSVQIAALTTTRRHDVP